MSIQGVHHDKMFCLGSIWIPAFPEGMPLARGNDNDFFLNVKRPFM